MGTPLLVLVHPSVAAKSAGELIALAKASPGKLNLASGGVGSTGHMSAELFQMMAGIKLTHVPYRGEAPALTDLIAGQAQVMVSTTGSSLQYAKAGTVRVLATTTDERVAELPNVPPLSKMVPGYQANAWNGLCAPKGTPQEIVNLLNKEVNLAIADPKIKERIASLGGVALPGSPEDYGRTIAADTEKWAKVVQFSGAHVNWSGSHAGAASRRALEGHLNSPTASMERNRSACVPWHATPDSTHIDQLGLPGCKSVGFRHRRGLCSLVDHPRPSVAQLAWRRHPGDLVHDAFYPACRAPRHAGDPRQARRAAAGRRQGAQRVGDTRQERAGRDRSAS